MRVFLALDLPMAIRSQLVLQQFLLPVKRKQPPENFHITMVFLGEGHPETLDDLDAALSRLEVAPLSLRIEGLGLYGKSKAHNLHACVTLTPELLAFHDKLTRLARTSGFDVEARRFSPHVTLAYLSPGQFIQPELEAAVVRDAGFRTDAFEVRELVLYRSHLRRDGAQYDVLERYPLSASDRDLKQ